MPKTGTVVKFNLPSDLKSSISSIETSKPLAPMSYTPVPPPEGPYQQPPYSHTERSRNFVMSVPKDSSTQTIPPQRQQQQQHQPPPQPIPSAAQTVNTNPPRGVSLFEWYKRPRPRSVRVYGAEVVQLEDQAAPAVEVAPVGLRLDMPYWNGKHETIELFCASMNMFVNVYRSSLTRYQAIYLCFQALPTMYQLEIADLQFVNYYEILWLLPDLYYRSHLLRLKCRSNNLEDIYDYLDEHMRLFERTESIAGEDAMQLVYNGLAEIGYNPPVQPKPTNKDEHMNNIQMMKYHLKFQPNGNTKSSVKELVVAE